MFDSPNEDFHWTETPEAFENAFTVESANIPVFGRFGERYGVVADGEGSVFTWEFFVEPRLPAPPRRLVMPLVRRDLERIRRTRRAISLWTSPRCDGGAQPVGAEAGVVALAGVPADGLVDGLTEGIVDALAEGVAEVASRVDVGVPGVGEGAAVRVALLDGRGVGLLLDGVLVGPSNSTLISGSGALRTRVTSGWRR